MTQDLELFWDALRDEDQEIYKDMRDEVTLRRWILCRKRIDWNKFFAKNHPVHELAKLAVGDIRTSAAVFINPDWGYTGRNGEFSLMKYKDDCPDFVRRYDEAFCKATHNEDLLLMKKMFDIIKELV